MSRAVQGRQVLVAEQLPALAGEEPVEGVPTDMLQVQLVGLAQPG
jgi:hypothetical protein